MYIKLPGADVVLLTEGNIIGCDTASATWTRRGLRPWHVNTISTREPGDLPLTICQCRRWPAPGRRGVIAGDVRRGEVGLAHSSGEAGEQPERSGVSGAKERGQGERGTATHAPDTEPGKHVTEAVTRAEAAKQRKKERFTALFHLLTVEDWKPHSSP